MFSSQNLKSVVATYTHDPAADDQLPVFVAPNVCTIVSAKATVANTTAASTANYFDVGLVNKGTAGAGTIEISSADIGGTAGWVALTPIAFTIDTDNNQLASGECVAVDYDETGTATFGVMTVQIDYVTGQGA